MNNLYVHHILIKGCHERMFIPLFDIDSDFSENEEYYREDTLTLGFKNESERCSKELYDKHFLDESLLHPYKRTLSHAFHDASGVSINGNQFILGNKTYTSEYEISIMSKGDYEYEIILSRLSYNDER
tara:strand:- start:186 stop:569 length:384 start_codon:yes stop_codon:yes gene_type:complete